MTVAHAPRQLPGRDVVDPRLTTANPVQILLIDDVQLESRLVTVSHVRTFAEATGRLRANGPQIVVTELALPDGDGVEICRIAKALPHPPLVIVTTSEPTRVPAALNAGCNSVLLKPYSPNLLHARIGRLLQLSDRTVTIHRAVQRDHIAVALQASTVDSVTTNHVWSDIPCVSCGRSGATSFDFASRRRMWCACLSCEHVWMTRRREYPTHNVSLAE